MTTRAITIDGFERPAQPPDVGPAPMLQWIPIAQLVVDEAYQRPLRGAGRRNVREIAAGFRWSRFAPVVVSPIAGGLYAIVDGQHRTTAALLAGFEQVPCQVIVATGAEQAQAFSAINGKVTAMPRLALHRAAAAGGDIEALAIEKAARFAGVTILPYPKAELMQEPGETMAVGTMGDCLRTHGETILVLALRAIVGTRNNVRGGVLSQIIAANCAAIAALPPSLRADETRVIAAFDHINLIRELSRARTSERPAGMAIARVLAGRVETQLRVHLAAPIRGVA